MTQYATGPLEDALKRVSTPEEKEIVKKEFEDFEKRYRPLILALRDRANILEITGQWPADEQYEQVWYKLESALQVSLFPFQSKEELSAKVGEI